MLRKTVEKYPDSLCYDFQSSCANFKEAEKYIISFANFLAENKVKKGDRVVINLPIFRNLLLHYLEHFMRDV